MVYFSIPLKPKVYVMVPFRFLRLPIFLLVMELLFSFKMPDLGIVHKSPGTPSISIVNMERDILNYVNLHRRSIGLKPLQINATESDLAGKHSYEMAAGKLSFGHDGIEERVKAISRKLGPVTKSGENVAYGLLTAKEVVDMWLTSPTHRRNIEGDFLVTGIGVSRDRRGIIYYTQIFTR